MTEDDVNISVLVQTDDQKTAKGADDQLNVTAHGTATSTGLDLPASLLISVVRIANHLTTVGLLEFGCGVANPDDTRLVLKYEVSVPDWLSEPFEPALCPGTLHVATGGDDEALSSVAGDCYQALGGAGSARAP